ncbi:MAG: hypothetical protein UX31_C0047G0001 [Candidatus Nomurabacteria bacterium GW2011_GWA1_46_11]|uniref:Bacterial sugar transferase domain-containing protein n=3 Tax=Parcubacteria group TaxID=1794811 RepID=A0A1F8G155_9BACT|nr:MAG: hypothetical protein UX31_C0047G0001 [Candidatus Nomurabacteria bacterium GW2011_GWA1_46_11]KKU96711.1 MAG: hypothetical protein UY30_C0015G0008 [Parcubacteria group bacterium GW2011_GWB1_48_6]OGN19053.1 MAG: hypothetical protein A3F25_02975 [Candidatus Yanofskybacteria bacterium RIFCSPHIGHO2_12_FULL_45_19b]OGN31544.1 MAG: hypothetical protein A3I32_00410 [Candidatus Yanofskybacteria bacterium RIFCSPLOWO2_02_FULL_45_10]
MKRSELFFSVLSVPVDWLMVVLAGLTTYLLRTKILSTFRPVLFEFNLPLDRYFLLIVGVSFLFLAIFALAGLYSLRATRSLTEELARIIISASAGTMLLIIYIFLRQELFNSRFLVLGNWLIVIIFVILGRGVMRRLQRQLVGRYNFGVHRVMVIGEDESSRRIVEEINSNPAGGYRIVKQLANPAIDEIKFAIGNPGVDEVILANPNFPAEKVTELVDFCNDEHIGFRFVANLHQTLTRNFSVDLLGGLPLVELRRTNLEGWGRVYKRIVDLAGATVALVICSPLFLVVAFAIKWETAGPVFVRLNRISKNRHFGLLKFRSMVENAEELKPYLMARNERADGPLFKMKNDPRLTKVGRFIRHYRIDELPQFWNVLKGQMALVGPRPHQPDEIAKYQKHHKKVLSIKAGATGLAQVSGSSDLLFEEEVALDSFYLENWSLWQDIKIILRTAIKMFADRSAV